MADEVTSSDSIQKERFKDEYYWTRRFFDLITKSNEVFPDYKPDTRVRDAALQRLIKSESLLSGVIASSVSRDKNRGWILTGTARQVSYFSKRLHSVHNGIGWRQFISMNSTAWYSSNLGYVSEIGFKFKNGPAETLWNMDSTKCNLTNKPEQPLIYNPKRGEKIPLHRGEYIHGNSMPSFEEEMNYAGFCAVERSLLFTRIMIGIHQHQLEKLGVAPPKGVMLGSGIQRKEWIDAVQQLKEDRLNVGSAVYEGVMGLFAKDPAAKLTLIGLSQLPDNFALKDFVDVVMQGYALSFGFPVGEFWSIETGSFGRTGEMSIQQEQAYAKGEMDFALSLQEQLQQYFLPTSVQFSFESRNDKGYHLKAEIDEKRVDIITKLYEAGLMQNASIITLEEARALLAEANIIPKAWSGIVDQEEEVSDLQEQREIAMTNPELVRVMRNNPNEPIVSYRYSPTNENVRFGSYSPVLDDYDWMPGEVKVIWENSEQAFNRKVIKVK